VDACDSFCRLLRSAVKWARSDVLVSAFLPLKSWTRESKGERERERERQVRHGSRRYGIAPFLERSSQSTSRLLSMAAAIVLAAIV
jgi:hypothetical protein